MMFSVHLQALSEVLDSLKLIQTPDDRHSKHQKIIEEVWSDQVKKNLTVHHVGFPAAVSSDLDDFWAMCREIKTNYVSKFFLQCFPKPL